MKPTRTYRLTISSTVTVPAGVEGRKVAAAIKSEWWLENGEAMTAKLPLGVRNGYKNVRYGNFRVRAR